MVILRKFGINFDANGKTAFFEQNWEEMLSFRTFALISKNQCSKIVKIAGFSSIHSVILKVKQLIAKNAKYPMERYRTMIIIVCLNIRNWFTVLMVRVNQNLKKSNLRVRRITFSCDLHLWF